MEQFNDIITLKKGTKLIFSSQSRIRRFKYQATSFLRLSKENWENSYEYCYVVTLLEDTEVLCYGSEQVRFVLSDSNFKSEYKGRNKVIETKFYTKYGKYFKSLTTKDLRKSVA